MVRAIQNQGRDLKDHKGNKLYIGDKVACINSVGLYARVYIGEIYRETNRTVFIQTDDGDGTVSVHKDRNQRILKISKK